MKETLVSISALGKVSLGGGHLRGGFNLCLKVSRKKESSCHLRLDTAERSTLKTKLKEIGIQSRTAMSNGNLCLPQ